MNHKDMLNRPISTGDYVIAATYVAGQMGCYKVIAITNKMIRVVRYDKLNSSSKKKKLGSLVYSSNVVKIPEEDVTFYILSKKG